MSNSSSSSKIGLSTATIVGMNAMIGAGIFGIPVALSTDVGPAGIFTILLVSFGIYFMANSLARLASLYPEAGSFYIYAKQWGGHIMGVLSSYAYLIGLLIAMGLLSQMAGYNLQHYFPSYSAYSLGLITLVILVILNSIGVIFSEFGQQVLICCTVFPLLASTILCFTKANFSNLVPLAPHGWLNVLKATRVVIFSFFGFECAASLFSVVRHPEKNVPKALAYSLIIVSGIYMLFTSSIILSIPLELFNSTTIQLSSVLRQVFPNNKWLIEAIHLSTLSAIVGTIHSMIWSSSSLLVSLTGFLKNNFAKNLIKKNYLTNRSAVFLVGIAIFSSFTYLKSMNLFFCLTAIFIVFSYSTSMISLLTLKKEWKNKQNIKTIIGLCTATVIFSVALEGLVAEVTKLF